MILRLYGRGKILSRTSEAYADLVQSVFQGEIPLGTRQFVRLDVDLVQTSCGYGVPLFSPEGERQSLDNWASSKGAEAIEAYWREKNVLSMDGLPTGMFDEEASS